MKPAPFQYLAPESLSETIHILDQYGDEAKLLAGGQSLVPTMNFRLSQPTILVDLNRLHDLSYVREKDNGALYIGAMTRHRQLERDSLIAKTAPLMHEAMPFIAHMQIRTRGTIGGSLAHADPAAELPVILTALDGRFLLRNKSGERWVKAIDFFQGIFHTALDPDEILVEVVVPPRIPNTGYSFIEISRRKGDFALIGVAALLSLNEDGSCRQARLVYLNADETPVDAIESANILVNERPSAEVIEAVANHAVSKIRPSGTIHASASFLRHLAGILTKRALATALERINIPIN